MICAGQIKTREGCARLNVGAPDARRPRADSNFPTPSGKREFASTAAQEGGPMLEVYRQCYAGSDPGGAVDPLPDYRAEAQADEGPFLLVRKVLRAANRSLRGLVTCPRTPPRGSWRP
jgi:hypothetical protein